MKFDESVASLPEGAAEALASLWRRVLSRGSAGISREELRPVARHVSAAARACGMRPEHLLIAVKESWSTHAPFSGPEERHDTQWVLTEVVSLCIREFYRSPPAATGHASREHALIA